MRGLLKCEACGKITQIKIQIGYLDYFQIYICCGNCGIIFSGKNIKNEEAVTARAEFNNAIEISYLDCEQVDFICDASGELLMKKVTKLNGNEDLISKPMWMKFKDRIGIENLQR